METPILIELFAKGGIGIATVAMLWWVLRLMLSSRAEEHKELCQTMKSSSEDYRQSTKDITETFTKSLGTITESNEKRQQALLDKIQP